MAQKRKILTLHPKSNRGHGLYFDIVFGTVAILAQGTHRGDAFAQPHFLHGFESRRRDFLFFENLGSGVQEKCCQNLEC